MLTLERVGAAYGLSRVLSEISLSVGRGELVTLLGRNGAGKSTLLRTIAGLHPAAAGRVIFAGADITGLVPYERARRGIGYVPQGRGIFPHLTVRENLRLGLAARFGRGEGRNARLPDHVFDLFPVLARLSERKGGLLSGGEQQQLAIARALATKPALLLLDEPTEGLQPSIVQDIQAALKRIRRELNVAMLLVEQYLDFAWSVADRFYVIQRGSMATEGNTRERAADTVAHLLSV
jgi:urea transport system ATP-binding protein